MARYEFKVNKPLLVVVPNAMIDFWEAEWQFWARWVGVRGGDDPKLESQHTHVFLSPRPYKGLPALRSVCLGFKTLNSKPYKGFPTLQSVCCLCAHLGRPWC